MNRQDFDNPMRRNAFDLPALCIEQCAAIEAESRMMISIPEYFDVGRVILTGCGDSYAAGLAAKYAFEELAGVPAEVVSTIDLARHISPEALRRGRGTTMVIAVSNSGMVARVGEAIERAGKYGCLTVGVTGNPDSTLAKAAGKVLKLSIPKFEAGNGVRSYLVSMLSLFSIAIRMGEAKCRYPMTQAEQYRRDICDYARAWEGAMDALDAQMFEIAQASIDCDMFDFVASGPSSATACFSQAKVAEATGDYAGTVNTEDWMHMNCFLKNISRIFTMVIAHAGSPAQSRTQEVIDCMADMKRRLFIVTDGEGLALPEGAREIRLPACPHEWMAPLLGHAAFSLLAGYLCELKHEAYGRGCRDNWAVCGTTDLLTKSKVEIY